MYTYSGINNGQMIIPISRDYACDNYLAMQSEQQLSHEPSWDELLMKCQDSNGDVLVVCNNDKCKLITHLVMRQAVTATEV